MTWEALWTFIEEQRSNEFLIGGVGLALLGMTVAAVRASWFLAHRLFWKLCAWSVTVDNRNDAYRHLLAWLSDTGAFERRRRFRLDIYSVRDANGDYRTCSRLTPESGRYWIVRDGVLTAIDRSIDDKPIPGGGKERVESLSVTLIGLGRARAQATFQRWLEAAEAHGRSPRDNWPRLVTYADYGDWTSGQPIRPRPLATVITRDGAGERLAADARAFFTREAWYAERGIPWRRGYLLHGPPGTGKSSLIRAIASELKLDLAIVDLTGRSVTDARLRDALADAPARSALVLEDVDAAFAGREAGEGADGVSFSGLLNALDGLAAQEGRLVFMTTNHPEKLDPALIRPGRADMHVALGFIGPQEAAALFGRFFPEETALRADLDRLAGGEIAPAAAQAALLAHAEDAPAAHAALAGLFTARTPVSRIAAE